MKFAGMQVTNGKNQSRGLQSSKGRNHRPWKRMRCVAAMLVVLITLAPIAAQAATYDVNSSASLENAIKNAVAGDTINFLSNITLEDEMPPITVGVTIEGNGKRLYGDNTYRGLLIDAGGATVNVNSLYIEECTATGGAGGDGLVGGGGGAGLGGALMVQDGTVNLTDVYFKNNEAVGGKGGDQTGTTFLANGTGAPSTTEVNNTFGGGGGLGGDGGSNLGGTDVIGGAGGGGVGMNADGGDVIDETDYAGDPSLLDGQDGIYTQDSTLKAGKGYSSLNPTPGAVGDRSEFGGGGAGTYGDDSSFGAGGGGGLGVSDPTTDADRGDGGDGAWGGGGGGGSDSGGDGGFAGGGGAAGSDGSGSVNGLAGDGGFGGGGGGALDPTKVGIGGFGAGTGGVDNPSYRDSEGQMQEYGVIGGTGGGGMGAGGAIFVADNAQLTINYTTSVTEAKSFVGDTTTGGAAGQGVQADSSTATAGQAIGDAIFLGSDVTINVAAGEKVRIDESFGGAQSDDNFDPTNDFATLYQDADGGIVKDGAGTLDLRGNNTYIGDTTILAGTLLSKEGNPIGDYSQVVISPGATLQLEQNETIGYLSGTGGTVKLNGRTLTLIGTKENDPLGTYAGIFDIDSVVSPGTDLLGSKVVKEGDGRLTLTGDSSAEDFQFHIYDGTVIIGNLGALGDPNGQVARIYTDAYENTAADLNTLEFTAAFAGTQFLKDFLIESGKELKVGGTNNVNLGGTITGATVAMKMTDAADVFTLSNDTVGVGENNFATLRLLRGTLNATSAAALGGARIVVDGNASFGMTAGGLTLSNNFTFNDASLLTIDTTTGNLTLSGNMVGTGGLIKQGANTLTLSGTNTYNGSTTINAGTLLVTGGTALADNNLVVLNGGIFQVDAAETIGGLSGTTNTVMNADLTLAGPSGGASPTYTGVLSGAGKLIKNGSFTQTLGGNNTYSGGTDINAGRIAIDNNSALGTGAVTFSNNAGLELDANGLSIANDIIVNPNGTSNGGRILLDSGFAAGGGYTFALTGNISGTGTLYADLRGDSVTQSVFSVDQTLINPNFGGFNLAQYTTLLFGGVGDVNFDFIGDTGTYNAGANNVVYNSAADRTFGGSLTTTGDLTKDGTGTLALNNATVDVGTATVNDGTLNINGGSFTSAGNITVAGGTLSGTGPITGNVVNNGGTVHAGNSPGTMTITGNYTNNAGGTVAVDVEGGVNSLLDISGTATINGGTVDVTFAPGETVYEGLQYTFLTAGGGIVAANFTTPATSNLARYVVNLSNDANNYYLTLAAAEYYKGINGFSSNQLAMGDYTTAVSAVAVGDMAAVLGQISPLANQGPAYDQLDGEIFGSTSAVGVQQTTGLFRLIATELRPGTVSWVNPTPGGAPAAPYSPAGPSDYYDTLLRGQSPCCPWTVWGGAYGMTGNAYSDGNAHGFNYYNGGGLVGMQRDFSFGTNFGVFYGYGQSRVDGNVLDDNVKTQSHFVGSYLTFDKTVGYTFLITGVGYDDYDSTRNIAFGAINRTAEGSHGGWQAGIYGEHGLTFGGNLACFQPYGALQYVYLGQESFTETGADSINLDVGQIDYNTLRTILGGRLTSNILGPSLEFRGQWIHELLDETTPIVSGQWAGGGGVPAFGIKGATLGRDWGLVGMGIDWQYSPQLRFFGGYDWQVNDRQSFHVATGGLHYIW